MKHFDLTHNSEEWFYARAGLATTSSFDKIITKKGAFSTQSDKYAFGLIAELIMGKPIQRNINTYAMEWGHQHEDDARNLYRMEEVAPGVEWDVDRGGFFTNDEMTRGASPDIRIISASGELLGLAEIKCPEDPANHIEFLCMDTMNPKYIPQVQGQLHVSGCEWVDWFSYYPGMPPARIRTRRDESFIALLDKGLSEFETGMREKWEMLLSLGHIDEIPMKEIREPKIADQPDYLGAG